MKLWHLRPVDNLPADNNPWIPWYDKMVAVVVRAETEADARRIANAMGGDETGPIHHSVYRVGGDPWLDPNLSRCDELTAEGEPGVIVADTAEA